MTSKQKMIRIEPLSGGAQFWRWKFNLGIGECEVKCLFCYNHRWDWAKKEWVPKQLDMEWLEGHFAKFKWVPGKCKQYEGPHDIMMSSTGDPFAPANLSNAYSILRLAAQYPEVGDHLRVTTKQAVFGEYGWDRLPAKALYGTSICTLDEKVAKVTMPNASSHDDLLWHLYIASRNNLSTWISAEPMLHGMNLVDLMEMIYPEYEIETFEEIWVGHLNYGFGCEKYAMSDEEILAQVEELADNYDIRIYVKQDVAGIKDLQDSGLVMRQGTVYEEVIA